MHEMKSESEVTQSCLTPSDPMDCSPPGSSIHGIFHILNIYLSISCIIDIQEIFVEQVNKRVDERIFKMDERQVE